MSGRKSFAFFVLLTCSLVLYVYRFFVIAANVSVFRIVLATWAVIFIVDVARRRIQFTHRGRLFLALCAVLVVVNAVDFMRLGGHPNLQRDIFNHLANLCLTFIVALSLRTEQDINRLLQAFIGSSLLAAAIALFTAVHGALPFESFIRAGARDLTQHDNYINDDLIFRRETSSFLDPNLYGVYCVLVLLCIIYSWVYVKRSRTLGVLFVLNLVCLDLTLSRTAIAGLVGGLGLAACVERRVRLFALTLVAACVLLLPIATMAQSHAYRREVIQTAGDWLSPPGELVTATSGKSLVSGSNASRSRNASSAPSPAAEVVAERAVSGRSLSERLPFIINALEVFRDHPFVGGGGASLLIPKVPWATAHISYLSLLARFGLVGALPYFVFMGFPLSYLLLRRSQVHKGLRFLVAGALATFLVVYLSYDIFLFFEVQYLFFGIAYAIILRDDAFRAGAEPEGAKSHGYSFEHPPSRFSIWSRS